MHQVRLYQVFVLILSITYVLTEFVKSSDIEDSEDWGKPRTAYVAKCCHIDNLLHVQQVKDALNQDAVYWNKSCIHQNQRGFNWNSDAVLFATESRKKIWEMGVTWSIVQNRLRPIQKYCDGELAFLYNSFNAPLAFEIDDLNGSLKVNQVEALRHVFYLNEYCIDDALVSASGPSGSPFEYRTTGAVICNGNLTQTEDVERSSMKTEGIPWDTLILYISLFSAFVLLVIIFLLLEVVLSFVLAVTWTSQKIPGKLILHILLCRLISLMIAVIGTFPGHEVQSEYCALFGMFHV